MVKFIGHGLLHRDRDNTHDVQYKLYGGVSPCRFPAMNPAEMHTLTRQFTVHFQGILDDVFDQENIIEWLGIEIISGEAVEALKAVA